MTYEDLVAMELHERAVINNGGFAILRVHGGWIYTGHHTSVFASETAL